jgi:hypothetical protein
MNKSEINMFIKNKLIEVSAELENKKNSLYYPYWLGARDVLIEINKKLNKEQLK